MINLQNEMPIYDYLQKIFNLTCLVSTCFASDDVKLFLNT